MDDKELDRELEQMQEDVFEAENQTDTQEENAIVRELLDDRRRRGFWNGILAGICGCCAVILAVTLLLSGMDVIKIEAGTQLTAQSEGSVSGNNLLTDEVMSKLNTLIGVIGLNYYEDTDLDELATGLYKGLFDGIGDPYSEYYTQAEYDNMMISTTANYYGIGAGLQQDSDTMEVTVSHVYDNSPAKTAGIQEGDVIVQVDDIVSTSMELSDLVTNIRGEEGTTVHLKLYREGESDYIEMDVERANVDIPTIEYKLLDDNIGYIQVAEFAKNTATQFETAIQDLTSQGMQAMVIDLRDNGGGLIESCRQMLDALLPEGIVVYTEDKYGNRQEYTSDADQLTDVPIAVLVNGNSASASEIFAGAIRDYESGTLIGTTTYGKGIVQTIKQLTDGSAYKLTVAKYFTPSGDYIHEKGIDPDIELEYKYTGDTESTEYNELQDNQILKAIEVLQEDIE